MQPQCMAVLNQLTLEVLNEWILEVLNEMILEVADCEDERVQDRLAGQAAEAGQDL